MSEAGPVTVIGGGLAGCEAAWQCARFGVAAELWEMRPLRMTPAHRTGWLAELVCSNSLRGNSLENAVGLLKAEMSHLQSVIMASATANSVPAGGALAVDRQAFSQQVTAQLEGHPLVRVRRAEASALRPAGDITVIAAGPLVSPDLAEAIARFTGHDGLSFYDAAAPIVAAASIDQDQVFRGSRYGRGGDDYLNCPLTAEEYDRFWTALVKAKRVTAREFERKELFEGCLPVEEMARRDRDALRFGPLKPVGLTDPRTGKIPHAVVQLRQDDVAASMFNMVGFQTNLKWGEQGRVFRMIPGLEHAEFERYGVMHRNTFIRSPGILAPTLQTLKEPRLLFAGQITGVEGYVESAATGLVAGLNAARLARGMEPLAFPRETALGALCHYVAEANPETFQPMNIAFGLLPPLERPAGRGRRRRREALAQRSLAVLEAFAAGLG